MQEGTTEPVRRVHPNVAKPGLQCKRRPDAAVPPVLALRYGDRINTAGFEGELLSGTPLTALNGATEQDLCDAQAVLPASTVSTVPVMLRPPSPRR
jgi:hypothetical protein